MGLLASGGGYRFSRRRVNDVATHRRRSQHTKPQPTVSTAPSTPNGTVLVACVRTTPTTDASAPDAERGEMRKERATVGVVRGVFRESSVLGNRRVSPSGHVTELLVVPVDGRVRVDPSARRRYSLVRVPVSLKHRTTDKYS